MGSAFQSGMGQSFDELTLGDDKNDEHGDGRHRRGRKLDVPHRTAVGSGTK